MKSRLIVAACALVCTSARAEHKHRHQVPSPAPIPVAIPAPLAPPAATHRVAIPLSELSSSADALRLSTRAPISC